MFSARIAPLLATVWFAFMGPATATDADGTGVDVLRNYLDGLESFSGPSKSGTGLNVFPAGMSCANTLPT